MRSARRPPTAPAGLAFPPPAAATLVVAALAAACAPLTVGAFDDPASTPPPRAAVAPAAAQGCWVGAYTAPTFARRGDLVLLLAAPAPGRASAQTAPAVSEEVPAGWLAFSQRRPAPSARRGEPAATCAEGGPRGGTRAASGGAPRVVVPVRAVVAEGEALSVRSEAYWDEDCGCTVVLTFTARQHGDTLGGTFSARAAATAAAESRGQWRVVRTAGAPGGTRP